MTKRNVYFHSFCIILIFALSFLPFSLRAKGETFLAMEEFRSANEYYRKEQYKQAAQKYLKIIQQGYQDPSLFYNLGNAYFKAGELGRAILFYQRAKQLLPRDIDIKKNLAYAESLTIDKIDVDKPGFISTLWEKITSFLTINELTILITGIYFLLILSSLLAIVKKRGPFRKIMIQLIILFSTLFILTGAILLQGIYQIKIAPYGVVISKVVEVKSGPEENLATLFSLHEGTTFLIQQKRGDWLQIILKTGWSGWLPTGDIQKI